MITTNTTIVSFPIPGECVYAETFKAQHLDWIENNDSSFISFSKVTTYSADLKGDEADE